MSEHRDHFSHDAINRFESLGQHYIFPIKDNRLVDDSGGQQPARRVDTLIC